MLDDLWDFADPAASEARLRAAAGATTGDDRAELLTQVARSLGLQEQYDEADAVLDTVEPVPPTVAARVALERGRVRNSSGHPQEAIPYFEQAVSATVDPFLVVDALHMLAISDGERAAGWTAQALAVLAGVTDERTLRWHVGLHHNLGWSRLRAGDAAAALPELEAALRAAVRWGTEQQVEWAVEAVDECRAALG